MTNKLLRLMNDGANLPAPRQQWTSRQCLQKHSLGLRIISGRLKKAAVKQTAAPMRHAPKPSSLCEPLASRVYASKGEGLGHREGMVVQLGGGTRSRDETAERLCEGFEKDKEPAQWQPRVIVALHGDDHTSQYKIQGCVGYDLRRAK